LVALGVNPTRPETGYGYLKVSGGRVERFVEKPDEPKARRFLKEGGYLWNAGMFVWKASAILEAIMRHLPEHASRLAAIRAAFGTSRLPAVLADEYPSIPRISIDFGVMEKADNVAVVEADFGWDDVGSWPAAASHRPADDRGNVAEGQAVLQDARGCAVFSEDGHLVAGLGVEDLVIVHTKDATLVCRRDRATDLKALVEEIRARGLTEYL